MTAAEPRMTDAEREAQWERIEVLMQRLERRVQQKRKPKPKLTLIQGGQKE